MLGSNGVVKEAEYYGVDTRDYYKELNPIRTIKIRSYADMKEQDIFGQFKIAKELRGMTDI